MPQYRSGAGLAGNPARRLKPQFLTCYAETDAGDLAATIADYAALAKHHGARCSSNWCCRSDARRRRNLQPRPKRAPRPD
jgi:hypothetical protein